MSTTQNVKSPGSQTEALAGLRLLAAIARAEGPPSIQEREMLAAALDGAGLPEGVTSERLLAEDHDVAALLRDIRSEEGRGATFAACFAMAHANRECTRREQELIDRIAKEWSVPVENQSVLARVLDEARETVWVASDDPIADPQLRASEIHGDIVKYSVIAAVLGLNPIPIASIATDLAVVGLQVKMFSDIGRHWGHKTTGDAAYQVMAGIGLGTGVRIAANAVLKLLPGAGSAFAAATNFASTWALGQVANQYWESGGTLDTKMLRDLFVSARTDGGLAFEKHKAAVTEARDANAERLDALASDYRAGRITLAEYQARVSSMT